MKWIILIATLLVSPMTQAKEDFYKVTAKPTLNVRSSSSMQSKVVGKVSHADIVAISNAVSSTTSTIVAGKTGKWVEIRYLADKKEQTGFVFDAFLEKSTQTQLVQNTAKPIQKEECTFNTDIFNEQWIDDNPTLKQKDYLWDAKKHQFGILLAPDRFLNITGGGCHHTGETHTLTLVNATQRQRSQGWYQTNLRELAHYLLQSTSTQGSKLASTLIKQIDELKFSAKEVEEGVPLLRSATPFESYGLAIRDYGTVVEFQIDWYIN